MGEELGLDVLDHGELLVSLEAWNYGPVGMSLRKSRFVSQSRAVTSLQCPRPLVFFSFCPSKTNTELIRLDQLVLQ